MSTVPSATSNIQQDLAAVEQVALAASSPFIHSDKGQAKVQTIASEVNLGIAALPLLADLFSSLSKLIHHAHASAAAQPAASQPAQ